MQSKPRGRSWLARPAVYGKKDWRRDIIAGLTVGILLIPQGIAYALLAEAPPIYGIYAGIIPLLVYTFLGSSPHVSVGPTALASILALSALNGIVPPDSPEYLNLLLVLAGLTGLIQLVFGLLRLGVIVSFLSRPVISGFVSAAAVLIIFSQLKTILGLDLDRTRYFHDTILALCKSVAQTHWLTALIGVGSIIFLLLQKKLLPKVPGTLVLIVLTTLLSWQIGWEQFGLATLGDLSSGLPSFSMPSLSFEMILKLLPAALILALISFVETLSIGKTLAEKHNYYKIQANRELIALGASKFIGTFFQAIPTSASFSRSAVNEESGGRTWLSGVSSLVLLALAAVLIMDYFYHLPLAVLAAIIISSVGSLFNWSEIVRLWRLNKKDWASLMVTFLVTLFGGLQFGIAAGVLLSLSFFILKSARPHLAELGRLPGTNAFRNISRFNQTLTEPDILIIRFDAELYFGNADFFQEKLEALIDCKGEDLRLVIIDAHTIHDIDTSGAYALRRIIDRLNERGVSLYLCGTIGPVRDQLFALGIMEKIGPDHQFLSIQNALSFYRDQTREERGDWDRPALQHK